MAGPCVWEVPILQIPLIQLGGTYSGTLRSFFVCACIVTLGHLRRAGRAGLEDNTTAVRGVRCEIYEAEKSWARWIPSVGGGGHPFSRCCGRWQEDRKHSRAGTLSFGGKLTEVSADDFLNFYFTTRLIHPHSFGLPVLRL